LDPPVTDWPWEAADPGRQSRPGGGAKRFARRALQTSAAVATVALVALAVGSAVGRWRVLPVDGAGPGTGVTRSDAVFVVPVRAQQVHAGDHLAIRRSDGPPTVHRVDRIADSFAPVEVRLDAGGGRTVGAELPERAWRVRYAVPGVGLVLRALAGPVQSALLMLSGLVLIARAQGFHTPPGSGWGRRRDGRAAMASAEGAGSV
jgi:hypothetical protein